MLCHFYVKIRREMIGDTPASGPKRNARVKRNFGIPERIESYSLVKRDEEVIFFLFP